MAPIKPARLGLLGSTGKMGLRVSELAQSEFRKSFLYSPNDDLMNTDLVIDFSAPEALDQWLEDVLKTKNSKIKLPILITGTTGLNPKQNAKLKRLSKRTPVLASANFSIGVHVLSKILSSAAPLLERLSCTSAQLTEIHHVHKKDSPSGTAIMLKSKLKEIAPQIKVHIHSKREGDIVGFHQFQFQLPKETILLGHRAEDRSIFARGALQAGRWLYARRKKQPSLTGLYEMDDFISFLF